VKNAFVPLFTPGIIPLEIWDLPTKGARLCDVLGALAGDRQDPTAALKSALPAIIDRCSAAPTGIVLTGGLAKRIDPTALGQRPIPTRAPTQLSRVPERMGLDVEMTLVCDLGQSVLKLSLGSKSARFERPLDLVFVDSDQDEPIPSKVLDAQSRKLSAWICSGISALAQGSTIDAVLLGMPVALDEKGLPGRCTYAPFGRAGVFPGQLQEAIKRATGADRILAVNDAVLAALALPVTKPGILVITLGTGPGAAFLQMGR
jgi:hypothetical protein